MKPKEKRRLLYHSLHACLPIIEGNRQLIVNDIADKVWYEIERWEVKDNVALADVRLSIERAEKYARMQHFLGEHGKDFVSFDAWKGY